MDNAFVHYTIPTKEYIKPYIETNFGIPARFTPNSYFGIVLQSMIDNPLRVRKKKLEIEHRCFDKFTAPLALAFPKWFIMRREYALNISDLHIITLNKLFEEKFELDFHNFCLMYVLHGKQIKIAIEDFCTANKIEIDQHISYDALKKKEYRYRLENAKKLSKFTSPLATLKGFSYVRTIS